MWDKLGKAIAKFLQFSWEVLKWALIFGLAYLIYTMGEMEGSWEEKLRAIPSIVLGEYSPTGTRGTPDVSYMTILVGASRSYESAERLLNEMRQKRISGRILPQKGQYYVITGSYGSRSQAEADLKRIRDKGFDKARIISP